MPKEVEVKTKLTLDSNAKKVLDGLQKEFGELTKEVAQTKSGFKDLAREAASMAIGVNLVPMAKKMAGMATSVFTVANATHDAQQGFAGLIAGMQGVPWVDARVEAERLHRVMRGLGADIGQPTEDIQAGFRAITTFLGGGARAFGVAERNIKGLTTIANVAGIEVRELGGQVGKMAAGFLSTESAVFNLLRGTGIFASDITKVTQEWQQLTASERIDRLTSAVDKVSTNLGKAAPTFTDLVTSFGEFGKMMLETTGEPIVKNLIPVLADLKEDLMGSREDIKRFAAAMGKDVARWVREAVTKMKAGFQYIRTHADEIKTAIMDAMKFARSTVSWILSNKEALAIAFGAKAFGGGKLLKPLMGGIAGIAKTGAGTGAATLAGRIGVGTATALGGGAIASAGGIAGGVAALGGFAIALGAATAAVWGMSEAIEHTIGAKTAEARGVQEATKFFKELEKQTKMGGEGAFQARTAEQLKEEERMRNMLTNVKGAEGLGESSAALGEWADSIAKLRSENRRSVAETEVAVAALEKMMGAEQRFNNTLRELQENAGGLNEAYIAQEEGKIMNVLGQLQNDQSVVTEVVAAQYMQAVRSGNVGAQQYIAGLLANSQNIQHAFTQSAQMTGSAFNILADQVRAQSESFAKMLTMKVEAMAKAAEKPEAPKISMSGGQVFKIQQDFRNEDPERIAIVFQKGILKAAERRVQASTSSPFGT